jgi:hypothetical protein
MVDDPFLLPRCQLKRTSLTSRHPVPTTTFQAKIAPYALKEIGYNGVTPVTDLHYSPLMTFGPSYDSTHANLGPGNESTLAYGKGPRLPSVFFSRLIGVLKPHLNDTSTTTCVAGD